MLSMTGLFVCLSVRLLCLSVRLLCLFVRLPVRLLCLELLLRFAVSQCAQKSQKWKKFILVKRLPFAELT